MEDAGVLLERMAAVVCDFQGRDKHSLLQCIFLHGVGPALQCAVTDTNLGRAGMEK